ncbi:photosystem II assembly protein Psb34 [Cyanobium sp. Morenito 9A2]|uniref:photosystem II assembly protein Psb34 n=1 Tax=Cyanobium sp. Morenito 9A2 TaxID=2823718 RepID=UPI0020CF05E3|nr:ssl1498 family light-harvesting-like protein [Cyanobium sp. Morenito 9A2]MCP9850270.1 ssl1498 family light-harvesting-like protein [Cyanobium sp. Morenito 9A2]
MAVTKEDGGKLNAFAKEPPMQLIEAGSGLSRPSLLLVIGGGLLVAVLVALAFMVS